MARIDEIAPDVYRISTYVAEADLQFNQFLIRDDEPLLYHTGMRQLFPEVRDAVASLIEPADLRWIAFSHFEPDECGSLNQWLESAPAAQVISSPVGAAVFIGDYADRPPRAFDNDETLAIGRHRLRFRHTPHLPHGWDASMLFEETDGILFCSDLLHQLGDVEPSTRTSVVDRFRNTLETYQQGMFADYMPYTAHTERYLRDLAGLRPRLCAAMHGSTYVGDGAAALLDAGAVMREILDSDPERHDT